MANLTIRNLDERVKKALRVRAAQNKRSMEAEARALLSAAVREPPRKGADWVRAFRKAIRGAEVDLPLPKREPGRAPPRFA